MLFAKSSSKSYQKNFFTTPNTTPKTFNFSKFNSTPKNFARFRCTETDRFEKMEDSEIIDLCESGQIPIHSLETKLGELTRAVSIRRQLLG